MKAVWTTRIVQNNEASISLSCVTTHLYSVFISLQLFDKVVSVLDPDMCVNSASALPTPAGNHAEEENCTEPRKEEVDRAKHGNKMQVYWQY